MNAGRLVLVGVLASWLLVAAAGAQEINWYSEDFELDPGYTSLDTLNVYWDSEEGNYYANVIDVELRIRIAQSIAIDHEERVVSQIQEAVLHVDLVLGIVDPDRERPARAERCHAAVCHAAVLCPSAGRSRLLQKEGYVVPSAAFGARLSHRA